MEALILFLWKSIVISGLLTAWYLLGLRGRRLHQYNRFFLLSVLFFSLTIPFLHFRLFDIPRGVPGSFTPVVLFSQTKDHLSDGSPAILPSEQTQPEWLAIAGIITMAVSLTLLVILLIRILKLRKMCRQYAVTRFEGINLILTDLPRAPFTFLNYVFWNRSLSLQDEIGQLILRHELTHIEQGHMYDKLASQVLTCIFWFNPFYWIIQQELNIIHEFVADEKAVVNRDTGSFARMLLQSYSNGSFLVPAHHFFSSSVKRRLEMLQNAAKPSYAILRRFIAVPLITGTVLLFSFSVRNSVPGDIAPAKKKILLLLDVGHGGADAGKQWGVYKEKEICLNYARRIKELSSIYHVDVQLTRDNDQYVRFANRMAISDKLSPDVFLSLHVGDEPEKEKEKAGFSIYVSGETAYTGQSSHYSNAILQAMSQDGIIPGMSKSANHVHSPGCRCSSCVSLAATQRLEKATLLSAEKESIYVLHHVQAPGMVMVLGNIKNQEEMQQLTDHNRVDVLCNAVLKGIVEGATIKEGFTGNLLDLLAVNQGGGRCP